LSWLGLFVTLMWATPARAELVFFANGRSLSVKAHRTDGDLLVLTMRTGGEIVCDPATITRITPDEVPDLEREELDRSVRGQADVGQRPDQMPDITLAQYGAIIDKVAAEEGVDARLVRAVVQVESAYQLRARSPKGAMGLMQLMPETARQYAVADPYDPVANIEAGIKHLRSLLARFPEALALAAYNAGEAAVQRFHGIPPYSETRNYVSRVLQLAGR